MYALIDVLCFLINILCLLRTDCLLPLHSNLVPYKHTMDKLAYYYIDVHVGTCVCVHVQRAAVFEGWGPLCHLPYSCGGLFEEALSLGESVGDIGVQCSQVRVHKLCTLSDLLSFFGGGELYQFDMPNLKSGLQIGSLHDFKP